MDSRKPYVPPAIVAEDVLEQTSLACNATAPFRRQTRSCFGGQLELNFAPGLQCRTNVAKGGAFTGSACQFNITLNQVQAFS